MKDRVITEEEPLKEKLRKSWEHVISDRLRSMVSERTPGLEYVIAQIASAGLVTEERS
jgi:hypothetical protein